MSFFDLSSGETLNQQSFGGKFEMGGEKPKPIPDKTVVRAMIDQAQWDHNQYADADYITLRWTVMGPDEYKNRKIFQKLWVLGNNPNKPDPSKAAAQGDKAKKMLAAIDINASGGQLLQSGEMPTDESLARNLANVPMMIKLGHWKFDTENGDTMEGNWVMSVSPDAGKPAEPVKAEQPAKEAWNPDADIPWGDEDDDIGF